MSGTYSFFKNGKGVGELKSYFENGKLYKIGKIKEGLMHGEWKYFDEEGKFVKSVIYDQGKEIMN